MGLRGLCSAAADPWELVDALQSRIPPTTGPSERAYDKADIAAFLAWMGTPDYLKIAPSKIDGAGLSVYTDKPFPRDAEVFKVPLDKTLSVGNVEDEFLEVC